MNETLKALNAGLRRYLVVPAHIWVAEIEQVGTKFILGRAENKDETTAMEDALALAVDKVGLDVSKPSDQADQVNQLQEVVRSQQKQIDQLIAALPQPIAEVPVDVHPDSVVGRAAAAPAPQAEPTDRSMTLAQRIEPAEDVPPPPEKPAPKPRRKNSPQRKARRSPFKKKA